MRQDELGGFNFGKLVKGALKFAKVLTPIANTVGLIVPGVGALGPAIGAADKIVNAVNSKNPAKKAQAEKIVQATKVLAAQGNVQALNGLTLLKKRDAARQVIAKHRVDSQGFVRRVA
ncbi:MAG TPA: hypothetical protein VHL05_12425 [Terriglobales bacterium]|jgi:hypothetical protein|nr:hypothetical protein [Terriglobales bacterium]